MLLQEKDKTMKKLRILERKDIKITPDKDTITLGELRKVELSDDYKLVLVGMYGSNGCVNKFSKGNACVNHKNKTIIFDTDLSTE